MLKPNFHLWATAENIAVIPNGVPEFSPTLGNKKEITALDPVRVLFLSTLSRQKGLFMLLDSGSLVIRECPNVEFHIAGPWLGSDTEELARTQLVSTGLTPHVFFHGALVADAKVEFLESGDIFVFPGIQQEGQPLVVLEAMCAGLPVIATDRGCLRETVVEGVTGYIVPPHAPDAIAARVLQLIRDPVGRKTLGQNARLRYEQEYTLPVFAARMADLFAQVIRSDYDVNQKRCPRISGVPSNENASRS
jgi:glycosyltransferase involved in cell wall biosynthesis